MGVLVVEDLGRKDIEVIKGAISDLERFEGRECDEADVSALYCLPITTTAKDSFYKRTNGEL